MALILFADHSPLKPALAAAFLRNLAITGVRCEITAQEIPGRLAPGVAGLLAERSMAWSPAEVLPLDEVKLFTYDLVISFASCGTCNFPILPGNPAVVHWEVEEPRPPFNAADFDLLCARLEQLVGDLFSQGYYRALVQARRNGVLVLDNLQEGILAHDLQRRIFFFNKAAEQITGYCRREVLGRDCHQVFPDRFCKEDCSFCDGRAIPEAPKQYPLLIRSRDGSDRHIAMSVMPLKNFLGSPMGVVASFRDLTHEHELASRLGETRQFSGMIGRDPKMLEVFQSIRELARSRVAVLIQGESGTGKELVAASIHNEGGRAGKLFVPVNCGAMPENLLESELFGHVKGAFTGAIRDKKGRFELADGGTIFLDEIGDISPAMQVKLLRVLQDGTFQRVGGEETVKVDVRVISATHKDLQKEIAAGRFREDLFYRLCVVPLLLPPLRERRHDLPLLIDHFLQKFLTEEDRENLTLSPEVMDALLAYHWPGNIRELQNVIRYILVHCREGIAGLQHLPPNLLEKPRLIEVAPARGQRKPRLTSAAVEQALAACGNNRAEAARRLGVSRATLYRFFDRQGN